MGQKITVWLIGMMAVVSLSAQSKRTPAPVSQLAGITLPEQFVAELGFFNGMAGKAVLELEAGRFSIAVREVELFIAKTSAKNAVDPDQLIPEVMVLLQDSGWKMTASPDDASYRWFGKEGRCLLGYFNASRKEVNCYLAVVAGLPEFVLPRHAESPAVTELSGPSEREDRGDVLDKAPEIPMDDAIVGNWGDIEGSQINYYNSAGYLVGSGLSKGYGFEFLADGSYNRSFLATSSYPEYRIFVYTSGTFSIAGKRLILTPRDRHYRKWQGGLLVTDEHSVPEEEAFAWKISKNGNTGVLCLYLTRDGEGEVREYCRQ